MKKLLALAGGLVLLYTCQFIEEAERIKKANEERDRIFEMVKGNKKTK